MDLFCIDTNFPAVPRTVGLSNPAAHPLTNLQGHTDGFVQIKALPCGIFARYNQISFRRRELVGKAVF
jgi:hypothetical protein